MGKLREDWIEEIKKNPTKYARWVKDLNRYVPDKWRIVSELECGLGTAGKLEAILAKALRGLSPPGTETLNPESPQTS